MQTLHLPRRNVLTGLSGLGLLACSGQAPVRHYRGAALAPFLMGRTARQGGEIIAGFPGVTLSFETDAKTATLDYFAEKSGLSVDIRTGQGPWQRQVLAAGAGALVIPFVEPGRVDIVRRNESWQGLLHFRGLGLTGADARPILRRGPKILCIGDSITCGAGTDTALEDAGADKPGDNGRMSFGYILAQHRIIAEEIDVVLRL